MSRAATIQSIIENRKPMAKKAGEVDEQLNLIEGQLRDFKGFISQFERELPSEDTTGFHGLYAEVDKLLAKVSGNKSKMGALMRRFDREHLSIGVIGRPKQGKSTLLQALSGLSGEVIPTGPDYCTGAASTLSNIDGMQLGDAMADIEFHTEYSFLRDVIKLYWKQKSPDLDLGVPEPSSIDEFKRVKLPTQPGELCMEQGVGGKLLDELRNIQQQLPMFEELLGRSMARQVAKGEIRNYVAQTDLNGNVLYKWRAVKKAVISCAFPVKDVGRIAFIDTPGLGQIAIGLEDYVNEAMDGDIDFAMFMRRGICGDEVIDNDIRLYGLISQSLPEIPLTHWSSYIVNRGVEDAGKLGILRRNIESCKHLAFEAGIKEVDARNHDEAREMFSSLLQFLAAKLPNLDSMLFNARMAPIEQLKKECIEFAEKALLALPKTVASSSTGQGVLKALFHRTWNNLAYKLSLICNEYRNKRKLDDESFVNTHSMVFKYLAAGSGVTLEEVERAPLEPGGVGKFHADHMQKLKVRLNKAFDEFDVLFDKNFKDLRSKIHQVLVDEDGGRLGALIGNDESAAWDEFVKYLELSTEISDPRMMVETIQEFRNASLSYRGFMQPRLRQYLDVFDLHLSDSTPFVYSPGESSEDLLAKFNFAWDKACGQCSVELDTMAAEPSMAYYATVDRFVDALLREGGELAATSRWELFYGENKEAVWPDEFGRIALNRELMAKWKRAVESLKSACAGVQS